MTLLPALLKTLASEAPSVKLISLDTDCHRVSSMFERNEIEVALDVFNECAPWQQQVRPVGRAGGPIELSPSGVEQHFRGEPVQIDGSDNAWLHALDEADRATDGRRGRSLASLSRNK